MRLNQIINIASSAYSGGNVALAHSTQSPVGDGLAEFIATELAETFEEGNSDLEQLNRAIEAIQSAQQQLAYVQEALQCSLEFREDFEATRPGISEGF